MLVGTVDRSFQERRRSLRVLLGILCAPWMACSGEALDIDASPTADGALDAGRDVGPYEPPDAGPIQRPEWPSSPAWDPPFDLDPEVGWRESTEPLCSPVVGRVSAARVWADSRGVFVLGAIENNPFDPTTPDGPGGTAVLFNDGTGWRTWIDELTRVSPEIYGGIEGVPGGPLLVYGQACAVVAVEGPGRRSCFYPGDVSLGGGAVVHASPERTWALHPSGIASASDGEWRAVTGLAQPVDPLGIRLSIWGDEHRFFVLGSTELEEGTVTDGVTTHHFDDVEHPAFTAFWVRAPTDIWLGTEQGDLVHFDGASTESVAGLGAEPIVSFWGTDTDLYFITRSAVGRVRDGAAEALLQHDRAGLPIGEHLELADISGDASRGEVYLALVDARHEAYECGATFVLWYDGTDFRRF